MIPNGPWAWPCWNCTGSYKFSVSVKKMGEGWTGGDINIVKAESSGEDPRATGGLVSNLPHPRVDKTKQHAMTAFRHAWSHKTRQASLLSRQRLQNAFNAMSKTSIWHVSNTFNIPEADLLEQICNSTTVYLAPNDAVSASITSDIGVAQRSIMSPQLFTILITDANWHSTWAESGYQSWFADWQGPGRKQSQHRPRLSC